MNAIIGNREYQVVEKNEIDHSLVALCADMAKRGLEAATYVLRGKRGATVVAYRGIKSGEFIKLY